MRRIRSRGEASREAGLPAAAVDGDHGWDDGALPGAVGMPAGAAAAASSAPMSRRGPLGDDLPTRSRPPASIPNGARSSAASMSGDPGAGAGVPADSRGSASMPVSASPTRSWPDAARQASSPAYRPSAHSKVSGPPAAQYALPWNTVAVALEATLTTGPAAVLTSTLSRSAAEPSSSSLARTARAGPTTVLWKTSSRAVRRQIETPG